jgi:hypothetical protein
MHTRNLVPARANHLAILKAALGIPAALASMLSPLPQRSPSPRSEHFRFVAAAATS